MCTLLMQVTYVYPFNSITCFNSFGILLSALIVLFNLFALVTLDVN